MSEIAHTFEEKKSLLRERTKLETILGCVRFAMEDNIAFCQWADSTAECRGSFTHLKRAEKYLSRKIWENREQYGNRR